MTFQMHQMPALRGGVGDWLELSGMRGLGQSGTAELAEIVAKKAQVKAEIARLKGGGVPTPGGFSPQGTVSAQSSRRLPITRRSVAWPRVAGVLVALGIGAYAINRIRKRKRG